MSESRLESIFHRARVLEGEARVSLLAAETDDDPLLRRDLEALLAACAGATQRLGEALGGDSLARRSRARSSTATDALGVPERVGAYQIEEEIGRGGLAVVYRGQRLEPGVSQRVAIKVTRFVSDDDMAVRAIQERWILSRFEHPNIARFLDGGQLDDGRFYLVMEYVEGRAIDESCRRERRSIAERVALLVTVCRAVQFAHRQLVLHRDLKPDNVFVDADGVVKLLDFGIAKLLDDAQTPVALPVTRRDERWLTPAYASPEQREGLALTTASDVYALGGILYRLLTGRVAGDGVEEGSARKAPSVLLRDRALRDAIGVPNRDRGLGRDLDWVVAKALRSEPERRYPSPQAFADDLQRVLEKRPVLARPDRATYRIRRFVGRNLASVLATSLVVVSLLVGLGLALQQAVRARDAETRANLALAYFPTFFEGADPRQVPGSEVSVAALLDHSVEHVRTDPPRDARVEAAVLETLGTIFLARGDAETALDLLLRGTTLIRDPTRDWQLHAKLLNRQGEALGALERFSEAEPILRQALVIRQRHDGAQSLAYAESANDLAMVIDELGRFEESEAFLQQALLVRVRHLGAAHADVATVHSNLGAVDVGRGDFAAAKRHLMDAVEVSKAAHGLMHPSVATNLNNLGIIRFRLDDLEGAVRDLGQALEIREATLPIGHPDTEACRADYEALVERSRVGTETDSGSGSDAK